MHYYSYNIADYRKDTGHLKPIEHYIYRSLMDWYYLDEKPIPLETQVVIRRLSLGNDSLEDLENVLADFFKKQDDGYHQARIDLEIAEYHKKAKKNQANGKLGGRPKKTQVVIDGIANDKQSESEQNPNHKPLTINQSINTLSGKPNTNRKVAAEILKYLNLKANRKYKNVESNLKIIQARLKEFTKQELLAMIDDRCVAWATNPKMVEYLRPETLFGATKCAGYVGSLGLSVSGTKGKPWYISATGIEEKAKELGILMQKDEQFPNFKIRVYRAGGITPEMVRKAQIDFAEPKAA